MNILIESMTKFVANSKKFPWKQYTIRLWRQEESEVDIDEKSIKSRDEAMVIINKILNDKPIGESKGNIAKSLLEMDRMNAVEVIDETSMGCVVYKDWP